jgi:hypothetical protein
MSVLRNKMECSFLPRIGRVSNDPSEGFYLKADWSFGKSVFASEKLVSMDTKCYWTR